MTERKHFIIKTIAWFLLTLIIIFVCLAIAEPFCRADFYQPDPVTVIVAPPDSQGPVVLVPKNEITSQTPIIIYTNNNDMIPIKSEDDDLIKEIKEDLEENAEIPTALAKEIFKLTNKERENKGLTKLIYSQELQKAADIRAKEVSQRFSHTRPDGTSCHTVVENDYNVAGENLIMADTSLAQASIMMETWMNSEGHRANILLPEFTEIAIGVLIINDTIYVTQIFVG